MKKQFVYMVIYNDTPILREKRLKNEKVAKAFTESVNGHLCVVNTIKQSFVVRP